MNRTAMSKRQPMRRKRKMVAQSAPRKTSVNGGVMLLGGVALGAGLMYVLDPERGHKRRVLLSDKLRRENNRTTRSAQQSRADMLNRARGLLAESLSRLRRDPIAPDSLLEARVRAELGHIVSHPRSITVHANQGIVTLSGDVLANEVAPLLARVAFVRGVEGVENRMQAHARMNGAQQMQRA